MPQRPDLVARTLVPDYALGSHVAPLGLAFASGANLGPRFADGAFIGEHGSWNRRPRSGYRVVFVPFRNGRPSGQPIDVLTGFLDNAGRRRADRWASRSTVAAACWSQTTSATSSGGSPPSS